MGSPTVNINVGFSEPPIQTPLLLQKSPVYAVPYHMQGSDGEQDASVAANAALINYPWAGWFNSLFQKVSNGPMIAGTRANRLTLPPQKYAGDLYYETDTGLLYAACACTAMITAATNATPIVVMAYNAFLNGDTVKVSGVLGNVGANGIFVVSAVNPSVGGGFTLNSSVGTGAYTSGGVAVGPVHWYYIDGTTPLQQSQIAAFQATLTIADRGMLLDVRDYAHVLRWNGGSLFFYGNDASGYIVDTLAAPQGGFWQACDGSTVNILKGDGTLLSVTTPNWNGQDTSEISTGTLAAGVTQAGTVPTWQAGAKTDAETTDHTHPITVGTGSVNAGTGGAVSVVTSVTSPTGIESAHHQHNLTNANAKLNVPSPTAGLGKITAFLKYLRR